MPTRLLFVCMGNICRSPTAEAVMRHLVGERGLTDDFELDSAGTGAWHAGSPPDRRATAAALGRGIALTGSARQVHVDDFAQFDFLIAMDEDNLDGLRDLAPPGSLHKLRMLTDVDVPDPYYGGPNGFETVFDIVERGCTELLDELAS
jgi:protein-tyrosine phosphatase